MKNIAWAITGAGHYLNESVAAMHQVSEINRVCTFVSRAAEEVLQMYGLFNELPEISNGEYLQEIFLESQEGKSFPKTGRFMLGKYDILIITPATSNTVAKIVYGIADTLVTNATSLANKASVPIYILPTDIEASAKSVMPYTIDRMLCQHCEICKPRENCPKDAIEEQIELIRCDGCGMCVELCEYGAIRGGAVRVVTRDLDKMNIEKLSKLPGFTVLKSIEEIERITYSLP